MAEQIEMQFRPTLVISVGKTGALVREYLSPHKYPEVERQLNEPLERLSPAVKS